MYTNDANIDCPFEQPHTHTHTHNQSPTIQSVTMAITITQYKASANY